MEHKHDSKMMWLMMLACAVPLIISSFGSSRSTSPVVWVVLGLGLMFLAHWIIMRLMHRSTSNKSKDAPPEIQESTSDHSLHHH